MKLSLKHAAIFGRIQVDMQSVKATSSFYYYTDLYSLYKDGWFITERFGTVISLCKRQYNGDFRNVFKKIRAQDVSLDTLDLLWKPLAEQQFEKYKRYLLDPQRKKYTKRRVNINEKKDNLPLL